MDPKRRARLILILGVLLALLTFTGTFFWVSSAQSSAARPPEEPKVTVLVAVRDIPARTAITDKDIKLAKLDQSAAPPKSLTDPKLAVGKILVQPIYAGEPLLEAKFAPSERGFTVFPPGEEVQPGSPAYRIMTISVPDNFAVGGVLVPGDSVDIMYVFNFDPCTKLQIPTGPAAAQVCVTAAGPAGAPTSGSATTNPASKITTDTVAKIILGPIQILQRAASVYTIRVDAGLAERLAYIQTAGGSLQFLLRAPTDDRAAGTTGATFASVYTQFKFPLPERVAPVP